MHPNEMKLVFKSEGGKVLPDRNLRLLEAAAPSKAHVEALAIQTVRQVAELTEAA